MGKGDPEGGRPRKELSDEDFDKLVKMIEIQCTQDEICDIFGMTAETLNTRLQERGEESFSTLYQKHQANGKKSLRRAQWDTAKAGNATMQIWLGKQVLGQRDKVDQAHTSPDGSMTPQGGVAIYQLPDNGRNPDPQEPEGEQEGDGDE